MKTIIVACGGGIATSATCATKINMALEERGLSNLAKAEAVCRCLCIHYPDARCGTKL